MSDADFAGDKPLDEFGYEKFMRECDARTDKVLELYEKYRDHPDCEKIVAREMGWEWLEEAPTQRSASIRHKSQLTFQSSSRTR